MSQLNSQLARDKSDLEGALRNRDFDQEKTILRDENRQKTIQIDELKSQIEQLRSQLEASQIDQQHQQLPINNNNFNSNSTDINQQ